MKKESPFIDPFTISCQSVLAHEMGYEIQEITHAADEAKKNLVQKGKENKEIVSLLDRIIGSARVLSEMLQRHYQFQSDHSCRECDILEDLLNPSFELASKIIGNQKNSFSFKISDDIKRIPHVYVTKYKVQVILAKLIWLNFKNIYNSNETFIKVNGAVKESKASIEIVISPTHLSVNEGEDLFDGDLSEDYSLLTVKQNIQQKGGTVQSKVKNIHDNYHCITFEINLPLVGEKNDTIC